jgi:UDP-glucose:(heptosyl)LPS alpha-1,3-glucosyltransferase
MDIALCYEQVIPARGGMEVFIADVARRLVRDRHRVHLYAYERDAAALPEELIFHGLPPAAGPRFLRPWRFAAACQAEVRKENHDVVIGFVKTWYQDVIIPAGGLHVAAADHNLYKHRNPVFRLMARLCQWLNPSYWSYLMLERKQYLSEYRPIVIAVSQMVARHFRDYYGLSGDQIRVIHNAIDPQRFCQVDRPRLRAEVRAQAGIAPEESIALFVGHNYHLKGLEPLLHAVKCMPKRAFRLLVCGSAQDQAYRRLARRLGIEHRVHFWGYCKDVRQLFFASDFLVHPTFYDPCSLVVPEALACGLPVITSRFNGAAELMKRPLDRYVIDDPHDHQKLAELMTALLDPSERSSLQPVIRESANRWTFEDHYRSLLHVLREAARKKHAA